MASRNAASLRARASDSSTILRTRVAIDAGFDKSIPSHSSQRRSGAAIALLRDGGRVYAILIGCATPDFIRRITLTTAPCPWYPSASTWTLAREVGRADERSRQKFRSVRVRVLIVDDSVVMRMIVERVLRQAGLDVGEVLYAANGVEGLAALEETAASDEPLDLVLCDVQMPVMDGLDFLLEKQRRNLAPGVPVLMITAEGSDPQVLEAIAAGAQGYISKPFTMEQMLSRLASLLPCAA